MLDEIFRNLAKKEENKTAEMLLDSIQTRRAVIASQKNLNLIGLL